MTQPLPAQENADDEDVRTIVYCKVCHKTHAVREDEEPCAPGAWIMEEPYA